MYKHGGIITCEHLLVQQSIQAEGYESEESELYVAPQRRRPVVTHMRAKLGVKHRGHLGNCMFSPHFGVWLTKWSLHGPRVMDLQSACSFGKKIGWQNFYEPPLRGLQPILGAQILCSTREM